jgi:hypothetical protein
VAHEIKIPFVHFAVHGVHDRGVFDLPAALHADQGLAPQISGQVALDSAAYRLYLHSFGHGIHRGVQTPQQQKPLCQASLHHRPGGGHTGSSGQFVWLVDKTTQASQTKKKLRQK